MNHTDVFTTPYARWKTATESGVRLNRQKPVKNSYQDSIVDISKTIKVGPVNMSKEEEVRDK